MNGGLEAKIHEGGESISHMSLFSLRFLSALGLSPTHMPLHNMLVFFRHAATAVGVQALLPYLGIYEKVVGGERTRACAGGQVGGRESLSSLSYMFLHLP